MGDMEAGVPETVQEMISCLRMHFVQEKRKGLFITNIPGKIGVETGSGESGWMIKET